MLEHETFQRIAKNEDRCKETDFAYRFAAWISEEMVKDLRYFDYGHVRYVNVYRFPFDGCWFSKWCCSVI
jgi:hypothetical protein